MKTTMKFFKCLMLSAILMAFTSSCQKDNLEDAVLTPTNQTEQVATGADGQNGQDGATGAQGEQGPKGDKGEPGANGTDGQDGAQGEQGIQGERGEPGRAGANGADGINGADGQDGNANVIVSDWSEPKESSFSVNNPAFKALPMATGIKSKIKDGIILVYYDNDIQVQLLPRYTYNHLDGDILKSVDSHINHASNTLYITIRKYGSDLTSREYLWNPSGAAYSKGVRFRYVIVPDGTSAKNSNIPFQKMSYKEVMDHLGVAY